MLLAFLVALLVAVIAARSTARRLQNVVQFAQHVATGNLTARVTEASGDEIGQVAAALDKPPASLEAGFAALRTNQRQLETLLNSMQDAVIAVGADLACSGPTRPWTGWCPSRGARTRTWSRPFAILILDCGPRGQRGTEVFTARAASILPGRTLT